MNNNQPQEYDLNEICDKYRESPSLVPLFIIDRFCAKFELAKTIYCRYGVDFKTRTSDEDASEQLILDVAKLLLRWNQNHRDYKVLNTLLKAVQKKLVRDSGFVSMLDDHARDVLCDE